MLGPIIVGFVAWLVQHRYRHSYITQRTWLLSHIEPTLVRRGVRQLSDIDQADLIACRKSLQTRFPYLTGTTDALEQYLHAKGLIKLATHRVRPSWRRSESILEWLESL
jgi:hypothetical protein